MKEITNETTFQEHVNKELRDLNIPYFHRKSSGGGHRVTANVFKIHDIKMKWLDIVMYPGKGRTVFLELKWQYGKPDTEQQNFIDCFVRNGYPTYTIKSLDEWELVKKIELEQIQGMDIG